MANSWFPRALEVTITALQESHEIRSFKLCQDYGRDTVLVVRLCERENVSGDSVSDNSVLCGSFKRKTPSALRRDHARNNRYHRVSENLQGSTGESVEAGLCDSDSEKNERPGKRKARPSDSQMPKEEREGERDSLDRQSERLDLRQEIAKNRK